MHLIKLPHLLSFFWLFLLDLAERKRRQQQTKSLGNEASSTTGLDSNSSFWSKLVAKFIDDSEESEKRRQQLIAVTISLVAMVSYALAVGLVKIDILKTRIEYIETTD